MQKEDTEHLKKEVIRIAQQTSKRLVDTIEEELFKAINIARIYDLDPEFMGGLADSFLKDLKTNFNKALDGFMKAAAQAHDEAYQIYLNEKQNDIQ